MKKSRAPEEPTIRTRRRLMVNWCLTILVFLCIAWPETRESGGRHGTTGAAISEDRSRVVAAARRWCNSSTFSLRTDAHWKIVLVGFAVEVFGSCTHLFPFAMLFVDRLPWKERGQFGPFILFSHCCASSSQPLGTGQEPFPCTCVH